MNMFTRLTRWTAATALLSLILVLVLDTTAPSANAQPLGGTKLYLPDIMKPVLPPVAGELQLFANVGPQCASAYQFSGTTTLTVTGSATRFVVQSLIQNDTDHTTYRFDWTHDGSFWFSTAGYAIDHSVLLDITSSNTVPCTGEFPKGDYVIQLYVDSVLQRTGTIHVQ